MSSTDNEAWQDCCTSITSALEYMWKKKNMVDAEFGNSTGESCHAHMLVLSLWSPIFAERMQPHFNGILKRKFEDDPEIMKIVLKYLYSSDTSDILSKLPANKLMGVLEVAEKYKINTLLKKATNSLSRRKISPSNVIDFLDFGIRNYFTSTRQKCMDVIKNEGIAVKYLNKNVSRETIFELLNMEKIAVDSEAQLLSMAMSWLTHPKNMIYKSEVLSLVDLSSIDWSQYRNVLKDFPKFFSDYEWSNLLLNVAQGKTEYISELYNSRTTALVKGSCSSCMYIRKRIIGMNQFNWKEINSKDSSKEITFKVQFVFDQEEMVKLVNIELKFGPKHIPESEFTASLKVSGRSSNTVITNSFHLETIQHQRSEKYSLSFWKPLNLKTDDIIMLTLSFKRGLKANHVKVFRTNDLEWAQFQNINSDKNVKVKFLSTISAFCLPESMEKTLVISSFLLRFCTSCNKYLERHISGPNAPAPPFKKFKNSLTPEESYESHIIKEESVCFLEKCSFQIETHKMQPQ